MDYRHRWFLTVVILGSLSASLRAFTVAGQARQDNLDPATAFQAVSIRRSAGAGSERLLMLPGGRLDMVDMSVDSLVSYAFDIKLYQLADVPGWMARDRYTIQATATGDPTPEQSRAMTQALLADRFNLRAHFEERLLPVYLLERTGAVLGPRLKPRVPPCPPAAVGSREETPDGFFTCGRSSFARTEIRLPSVTMAGLANLLSGLQLDRAVFDRTGLSGTFNVHLSYSLPSVDVRTQRAEAPDPDQPPPIFVALQEQLGLRLRHDDAPMKVLVIDGAARPSEN